MITGEIINLYLNTEFLGLVIIIILLFSSLAIHFCMAFFDLNRNNRYFYYVMFIVLILICFYGYQNIEKFNKKTYKISKFLENSDDITVFGRIYNVKQKEKTIELYIDKVSLNNRKEICKNADKILLIYYKKDNNEKNLI